VQSACIRLLGAGVLRRLLVALVLLLLRLLLLRLRLLRRLLLLLLKLLLRLLLRLLWLLLLLKLLLHLLLRLLWLLLLLLALLLLLWRLLRLLRVLWWGRCWLWRGRRRHHLRGLQWLGGCRRLTHHALVHLLGQQAGDCVHWVRAPAGTRVLWVLGPPARWGHPATQQRAPASASGRTRTVGPASSVAATSGAGRALLGAGAALAPRRFGWGTSADDACIAITFIEIAPRSPGRLRTRIRGTANSGAALALPGPSSGAPCRSQHSVRHSRTCPRLAARLRRVVIPALLIRGSSARLPGPGRAGADQRIQKHAGNGAASYRGTREKRVQRKRYFGGVFDRLRGTDRAATASSAARGREPRRPGE